MIFIADLVLASYNLVFLFYLIFSDGYARSNALYRQKIFNLKKEGKTTNVEYYQALSESTIEEIINEFN